MNRKFILLPITLTALTPIVSIAGCGDPILKNIEISQDSLILDTNETKQLSLKIEPKSFLKDVVWTSSDSSIVKVDSEGLVKGISGGKAKITAKVKNFGLSAECSVVVRDTIPEDRIVLEYWDTTIRGGRGVIRTANPMSLEVNKDYCFEIPIQNIETLKGSWNSLQFTLLSENFIPYGNYVKVYLFNNLHRVFVNEQINFLTWHVDYRLINEIVEDDWGDCTFIFDLINSEEVKKFSNGDKIYVKLRFKSFSREGTKIYPAFYGANY